VATSSTESLPAARVSRGADLLLPEPAAADPLEAAPARGPRPAWLVAKRAIDIAAASILLVALLPVMIVIAALVKATSRGPVVFRQVRCGRGARPFTVYKFRTMWVDADPQPHAAFIQRLADERDGAPPLKKLTRDDRITPLGRFLRRASLDELPQLVNVLRGSMSLIGPRPVPVYELQHYRPRDHERFGVRPGITGLWQVSGRSHLGFYEMLDLDVAYARRCSPALDATIALRTPVALLRGRTA
jgi:lipopolysaccharide/colanic/teichoic acid biosynthesis glycosyltransferase